MNLDKLRAHSQECIKRAMRADRLHKSATRRLRSFSILARLIKFSRFQDLRRKRKNFENERFNQTTMALYCARAIKLHDRALRRRLGQ